MKRSEQINELTAALAKAQGAMGNAKFNKVNPHFRSKYADLAAIIDVAKKPLADNGLAFVQTSFGDDINFMLTTMLMHISGQWIASEYPLPWMPDKPQVMGAARTYARRYELASILGIAAEEDTDAEGVEEAARQAERKPPLPKPDVIKPLTEVLQAEVAIDVQDMAREAAMRGREVMRQFYKSRSQNERDRMNEIQDELEELIKSAEIGTGS